MSETPAVEPTIITVSSVSSGKPAGDTAIVTPSGHPDIIVKVLTPVTIIAVRAARVFLQTLLGASGVSAAGAALGFGAVVGSYQAGLSIAAGAAVVCVVQNLLELATKFDQSHPNLAG